jgi:ubiquinol-cytochrome c reductase iron-sulfur subunit
VFVISALSMLAFVAAFLFWPWEYVAPVSPVTRSTRSTPRSSATTFGLSVLALGIGVISYVKKFFPDEVSVQQRHDGASDEVARRTVMAQLAAAGRDTDIGRRSLIKSTAGLATGRPGPGPRGSAAVAPLVRDPWKGREQAALWTPAGARSTARRLPALRHRVPERDRAGRAEDQDPGAMMTVFPFREAERGDEEALVHGLRRADSPVMLIRLRPGTPVVLREGQEDFHYGDYYAFSKICTHLGCPTSLFESQTNRILCPCHQSQFIATEYGKPVFGPAARPLPQLPITVNDEGYFVARGDFPEAIGPSFWEIHGS